VAALGSKDDAAHEHGRHQRPDTPDPGVAPAFTGEDRLAGHQVGEQEQAELEGVAAEHVTEHRRVALQSDAGDAGARGHREGEDRPAATAEPLGRVGRGGRLDDGPGRRWWAVSSP
jgi:hypothetical protein